MSGLPVVRGQCRVEVQVYGLCVERARLMAPTRSSSAQSSVCIGSSPTCGPPSVHALPWASLRSNEKSQLAVLRSSVCRNIAEERFDEVLVVRRRGVTANSNAPVANERVVVFPTPARGHTGRIAAPEEPFYLARLGFSPR